MSRTLRLFVSLLSTAAAIVVAIVLMPDRAAGNERLASSAGSDRYYFGREADIARPVDGSVQIYGGNAVVREAVHGDLIVIGGDLTFSGNGRVDGNVIHAGGRVAGAEGRVGGRVQSLATVEGAAATMNRSAVVVSLLLVWLIVAVVVTLVAGREVRISSVEVRASAFHCFALGLVAFTSFVITAIVFSYLVPFLIGVPLLAFLGVFAIVTKVFGLIAVFHAVGKVVAGSKSREQLEGRRWLRGDLAMVVIGLLLLGALRLIPFVGSIIWSCASVFGIGCALATKFGRREPAFLAWQPARVS